MFNCLALASLLIGSAVHASSVAVIQQTFHTSQVTNPGAQATAAFQKFNPALGTFYFADLYVTAKLFAVAQFVNTSDFDARLSSCFKGITRGNELGVEDTIHMLAAVQRDSLRPSEPRFFSLVSRGGFGG